MVQRVLFYFLVATLAMNHAFKTFHHPAAISKLGRDHRVFAPHAPLKATTDTSDFLARAEYLVLLWHSLSEANQEMGLEHSFGPDVSKGIYNHISYCAKFGLAPQYNVYESDNSILLEPTHIPPPELFPDGPEFEDVLRLTKAWVRSMIADFGVCPYTIDENIAGVPKGSIRYSVSDSLSPEEAFRDFWAEVCTMLGTSETEISTVLLVLPKQIFSDITFFEAFCDCLDNSLSETSFQSEIQLVFFHPQFKFKDKDGQAFFLFDDDGNPLGLSSEISKPIDFSRRSPWPIINILRTPFVSAVQKSVPEGKIIGQNTERLDAVGVDALDEMLASNNWEDLPVHSAHGRLRK